LLNFNDRATELALVATISRKVIMHVKSTHSEESSQVQKQQNCQSCKQVITKAEKNIELELTSHRSVFSNSQQVNVT